MSEQSHAVIVHPPQPTEAGAVTRIVVRGSCDAEHADAIAAVIDPVVQGSVADATLIFDLSGLRFMNSRGVGMLVNWYQMLAQNRARIVLVAPQPQVLDILISTGVTKLIAHGATEEEALLAAPEKEQ